MEYIKQIYPSIVSWTSSHGANIVAILVVAYIFKKFGNVFIARVIRKAVLSKRSVSKEAEKKREDTLIKIINGTLNILVWLVAGMMILSGLGIDIKPILAAAGVAGLAFGFGGQYLIRDIISGLFIIVENQFRVGDVVCFDGTCGVVENISLRMSTLRDLDGTVHHVLLCTGEFGCRNFVQFKA
jgi:small conductance mechanosensitive channel